MEYKECLKCGHRNQNVLAGDAVKCPECGAYYAKVEAQLKREADKERAEAERRARELDAKRPKTQVKTYKGKQSRAVKAFQKEAEHLESQGYQPASELWEAGRWNAFQILVCLMFAFLFLFIPLIGWLIALFLVFYLLIARPPGTLTVTYKRDDQAG
ncbi:uncharacterized Zn finger protein (UPF0148 family) [Marinobacterium sp. MBR-111]|jgi:uncharacterized Zn finger protein (UPF0148 family)|uniref:hypothetical protein n=1 Tax=Marinobacterium sp. MBR-111 TaxID=3156463 RepID=UPI00339969F8